MPSLPTITEVQELLRERGYEEFDPSILDVLHRGQTTSEDKLPQRSS